MSIGLKRVRPFFNACLILLLVLVLVHCKKEEEFEPVDDTAVATEVIPWTYKEEFTTNNDWTVYINDSAVNQSPLSNGKFYLYANQGRDCVRKKSHRELTIPDSLVGKFWNGRVEIVVDLEEFGQSASGNAVGYVEIDNKRIEMRFETAHTEIMAEASVENDSIIISTDLDKDHFLYPGILFLDEPTEHKTDRMGFEANACGADLYAAASLKIRSIEIRRYP